jgi:hypothetical protein
MFSVSLVIRSIRSHKFAVESLILRDNQLDAVDARYTDFIDSCLENMSIKSLGSSALLVFILEFPRSLRIHFIS